MGQEQCNPLPTPFSQKADDIVKELAKPVAIHDEKLVKEYQALVGSHSSSSICKYILFQKYPGQYRY